MDLEKELKKRLDQPMSRKEFIKGGVKAALGGFGLGMLGQNVMGEYLMTPETNDAVKSYHDIVKGLYVVDFDEVDAQNIVGGSTWDHVITLDHDGYDMVIYKAHVTRKSGVATEVRGRPIEILIGKVYNDAVSNTFDIKDYTISICAYEDWYISSFDYSRSARLSDGYFTGSGTSAIRCDKAIIDGADVEVTWRALGSASFSGNLFLEGRVIAFTREG